MELRKMELRKMDKGAQEGTKTKIIVKKTEKNVNIILG